MLAEVVERFKWVCHAYCLMGNHYHLLIETPAANLSLGMRQLNGVYTQRFNRRMPASDICFKGGSRQSWWSAIPISWSWPVTLS